LVRSRLVRLSRNSSLTRRVCKRSSEKLLRRSSPSVRGRLLMKGTPTNNFSRLYAPRPRNVALYYTRDSHCGRCLGWRMCFVSSATPLRAQRLNSLIAKFARNSAESAKTPNRCGSPITIHSQGSLRVAVTSSLPSNPCRTTKIRNYAFQVRCHCQNALVLRSHRQQFLFEIKIKRQRAR
jgi:hypothetical protein